VARKLLPKVIILARNAGVRGIRFDCAEQRASFLKDSAGRLMLSAIIGFFIVMSIGILIAHAMDAFRSDSRH
jgi:hypothetical protein